jgi:hypothetical protein
MSPPSSGSENKPSNLLRVVFCLDYSSTLKEDTCSSETLVDFQRTTQRYISESGALLRPKLTNNLDDLTDN